MDSVGSSRCPTPFTKSTYPEIPVMLSTNQVPPKIEYITDSRVSIQKWLSLPDRFEPPYPPETTDQPDALDAFQQPQGLVERHWRRVRQVRRVDL